MVNEEFIDCFEYLLLHTNFYIDMILQFICKIREGSKVSCSGLTCSDLFSNKNDELQTESGTQVFWTDKLSEAGFEEQTSSMKHALNFLIIAE